MFKNHPKGLIAAALANMGERFGFYTMMAILVLFLQTDCNQTKCGGKALKPGLRERAQVIALESRFVVKQLTENANPLFMQRDGGKRLPFEQGRERARKDGGKILFVRTDLSMPDKEI